MTRTMLTQSELPMSLWAEAVSTAVYIRNRCLNGKLNDSTPYEEWTGCKPYIEFLRIFGSKAIALEKKAGINKFMLKGKEYILVGYSQVSKVYRLWDRGTRNVVVRRDVRFHEDMEKQHGGKDTFVVPTENKSNTTTTNGKEEAEENHKEGISEKYTSDEEIELGESAYENETSTGRRIRGQEYYGPEKERDRESYSIQQTSANYSI